MHKQAGGAGEGAVLGDGSPANNVYTRRAASINKNIMPSRLKVNTLFKGGVPGQSTLGNMALSPDDIGGHFIRMVLASTRSGGYALSITGLPLSSYKNGLSQEAFSLGAASSNPLWLDYDPDAEVDSMRSLYPTPICNAWDCPLRRRMFYIGEKNGFRPLVPDPLRTHALYGSRSHPTQKAFTMPLTLTQNTETRVLDSCTTANGFCACSDPLQ
jgi:hypothetical protein